jgi:hypothetical protein
VLAKVERTRWTRSVQTAGIHILLYIIYNISKPLSGEVKRSQI